MRRLLASRVGRYSQVSVVNVIIGATVLGVAFGLGWSARSANLLGTVVSTVPSYFLNRRWVWDRRGRSYLLHEVVPFWAMALVGLALTTWVAGSAEGLARQLATGRSAQTAVVLMSVTAAVGVFWVARFALLELVVFADRSSPTARPMEAGDAAA